jgi:GT2 family glycosyltransferase
VVVVRSDDLETRDLVSARGVRLVEVDVPGNVAAMEAGRLAASGEIVAFTDDDAVPSPGWLADLVSRLRTDPRLGGVGGRDRFDGRDFPSSRQVVGKVHWYGRRVGEHHRGAGSLRHVDVLKGVNAAFRREALDSVGFDSRLRGAGSQPHWEVALCLGIKRAGWELAYDPAITVDHYEGARFGEDERLHPDPGELRSAAHNDLYGRIRWLPWWRKPAAVLYDLLVGTREAPGLALAVERALRTGEPRRVLARLAAATRGRLDALGTYLQVLRQGSKSA